MTICLSKFTGNKSSPSVADELLVVANILNGFSNQLPKVRFIATKKLNPFNQYILSAVKFGRPFVRRVTNSPDERPTNFPDEGPSFETLETRTLSNVYVLANKIWISFLHTHDKFLCVIVIVAVCRCRYDY